MCVNKRFIKNPYTRETLLVSCGHCPACLQEKADKRALKIKNSVGKRDYAIFATFTYENEHIPYIAKSDLMMAATHNQFKQVEVPIYRDKYVKSCRVSSTRFHRKDFESSQIDSYSLDDYDLLQLSHDVSKMPYLRNGSPNKVGVLYYPDMQLYFKRLRKTLKSQGYDFPIKYFCCGEYGSSTSRPHFHVLFIVPVSTPYTPFKIAIAKSWPFDSYNLTLRNTQIAKAAANYVSSYVNCASYVSPVLRHARETRPMCRHSLGFGLALDSFSLSSIVKAFEQRDLFYNCQVNRDGAEVTARFPYPKYVVHRFFPKFKGYFRLADNEIESIFIRPSNIYRFKERCFLDDIDCSMIVTHIENKKRQALRLGLDEFYYAYLASRIWNLRASCIYKEQFEHPIDPLTPLNHLQLYDNIEDYFTGDLLAPTLDSLVFQVYSISADPNEFRSSLKRHNYLVQRFMEHDKSQKIRHTIFAAANSFNLLYHY